MKNLVMRKSPSIRGFGGNHKPHRFVFNTKTLNYENYCNGGLPTEKTEFFYFLAQKVNIYGPKMRPITRLPPPKILEGVLSDPFPRTAFHCNVT